MHLSQIWRVGIFRSVIAMLYLFAHMRVAFDAKSCDETDHQFIPLAKRMALAAAHCGDDGRHGIFWISRG
jgi:hypothetical protein